MTVEFIIKVPGLFKAEGVAAVFYGNEHIKAIAVNKSIVVTSGTTLEWLEGAEAEYVVANQEHSGIDEVIDMEDSGIKNESNIVTTFQSAAQLALLACEPGPVAAKFLERLIAEDDYADAVMARSQKRFAAKATKTTGEKSIKSAKGKEDYKKRVADQEGNGQVWYKAKDGRGFTTDPAQARQYAGKPVLAKGNVNAA